jgi:ribosomal protein S27E
MIKACRVCANEIVDRHHAAKLCFSCADHSKNGGFKAHRKVKKAIELGILASVKDLKCLDCGNQAEIYDHKDYNKPLEVEPVCRSCNRNRGSAIPLTKEQT